MNDPTLTRQQMDALDAIEREALERYREHERAIVDDARAALAEHVARMHAECEAIGARDVRLLRVLDLCGVSSQNPRAYMTDAEREKSARLWRAYDEAHAAGRKP